ncbi:hypothetical protein FBD94_21240 [Pedobacter hiemivivus]|uniref:Uncharacterized protein n=1 Tax=Pedobacter hiemivivus TaxID=2530454 RepID=A0A4U1G177_9SPHI|nr:hypothetical protein [Pedobacter hiemivivus]TKC57158.1 hypothetical protein FBD94_21240 [Pedobacter hiemivivus]
MTAIVGVINAQGIAIAADSAVTVSGSKGTKVYNKGNKLFTLSKYHPIGIAIYGSASFMGIPLETLIKMYRAKLGKKGFDKVEDYKLDFLKFLKTNLPHVSNDFKTNSFFSYCHTNYLALLELIEEGINVGKDAISKVPDTATHNTILDGIFKEISKNYEAEIASYTKSKTVAFNYDPFVKFYSVQLENICDELLKTIIKDFPDYVFSQDIRSSIKKLFFNVVNLDAIWEASTGLVFVGFGEKEIYPSSQLVTIGSVIMDTIRHQFDDPVQIIPGSKDSNILPYVQGDVTWTVLSGIDPAYKKEVHNSISEAFNTISDEIVKKILNTDDAKAMSDVIKATSKELIASLENYKFETITRPLLETLTNMGKEDMAELAESLVNITSLKRKFASLDSSEESVGGPVDVAVITKGDGFVWMKRKHYFDMEINKGFFEKYYN